MDIEVLTLYFLLVLTIFYIVKTKVSYIDTYLQLQIEKFILKKILYVISFYIYIIRKFSYSMLVCENFKGLSLKIDFIQSFLSPHDVPGDPPPLEEIF